MRRLKTLFTQIKDSPTQESVKRVEEFLNEDPLTRAGFEFRSFSLAAKTYPATVSIPHKLLYVPRDILVTSVIGGTVAWSYAQFTQTALVATISAATVVRCFIGTYKEGNG